MHVQSLPIEIWSEILTESISLPTFLDPDHLPEVINPLLRREEPESTKYDHDRIYWNMERHRNSLMRVCRFWETYLRRFEHRYVRLADVYHGLVPTQALYQAIRIYFAVCDFTTRVNCPCFTFGGLFLSRKLFIPKTADISVKIMDGMLTWSCPLALVALVDFCELMPHLEVILPPVGLYDFTITNWGKLLGPLSRLRFLYIAEWQTPSTPFLAPKLTTLAYKNSHNSFSMQFNRFENFPSLEHLRFPSYPKGVSEKFPDLIASLRVIGHKLLSLQIGKHMQNSILPAEIWELCPRLERLDCGLFLKHPPPLDHPLHTISVFFPQPCGRQPLQADYDVPFLIPFLSWPSLRRVILGDKQTKLWMIEKSKLRSNILDWVQDCMDACNEKGVTLEDSEGVLFSGNVRE